MPPPRPLNEDYRIAVVGDLGETMRRHDPVLASLIRLAAMRFGVATVLISIVGRDEQVFAEAFGCDLASTDRDAAFCAHAIMDSKGLVVLDAVQDRRFRDNPLVVGAPFIRFYAGAPLVSREGMQIGTLCLIDPAPRESFPEEDAADLKRLADLVMSRINDRHAAAHANSGNTRAAEAAADAQHRLLSIVGHEFRTPLNAISGFSDMIARGLSCQCDATIEYAGHITTSVARLERLVERLLDYASLERGDLALGNARVPCIEIVREAVTLTQPEAMHHDVAIHVDEGSLEAVDIVVDPMHFSQAVTAIVGAAIAASLGDRPVVIAGRRGASGAFAIGVRHTAFAAPSRTGGRLLTACDGDSDLYRMPDDDGAGLGLPMTELLIEAHGGSLQIDREGSETEMLLWLPSWRVPSEPGDPKAEAAASAVEDLWLID